MPFSDEFKQRWRQDMYDNLSDNYSGPDAELWATIDWLWDEATRIGREMRDTH